MDFEDYKYVNEALIRDEKICDEYVLKLINANILFKLGNYKKSKIIIKELLDYFLIKDVKCITRVFNTLIKLSFLFGYFDKVFQIIKNKKIKFLDLQPDFFYIEVINNYYEFVEMKKDYPEVELKQKANDRTKKSFLYYILFLIYKCKDEAYAKEFLKKSINEEPLNMSVIYELINLGQEINTTSLNFALKMDVDIFNKFNFKSHKEITPKNENLNLEVFTVGGGDSIGESCYVISFNEARVMIDAGASISNDNKLHYPDFKVLEEKYEDIFEKLDYFFITHGHLDHCGAILEVYKKNPKIRMLMTEETREIIRSNLTSGKLAFEDQIILDRCLSMATVVKFRQNLKVKCKDNSFMNIEFFRAGHILGASSIYINNKDTGVFITGDYCLYDQETVKGMDIPKNYMVDLLITETTYGNKVDSSLTSRNYEKERFIYTVKNALKNGKKVLIPSFSIGRSQEIISILKKQLNTLENERLYVDGMVIKINKIYEKFLQVQFKGNNIYTFDNTLYVSKSNFINEEILNNKSCVVASSGMLQKGSTVIEYAKNFLKRKDCVCILTGYQANDSIGNDLKSQINVDSDRYISINGELINIKCELEEVNLSSHCTMEEILTLVSKIKPKKVLLVHGSTDENESYIYKILSDSNCLQVIQSQNKTIINI